MFKRKLKALDFHEWDKIDVNGNKSKNVYFIKLYSLFKYIKFYLFIIYVYSLDEQHIKKLVSWLENQKIRLYKIDDRKGLNNIDSDDWQKCFETYLNDVGCPAFENQLDKIEWLIGFTIKLEFADNCKYLEVFS
jgi:hypothetical protein